MADEDVGDGLLKTYMPHKRNVTSSFVSSMDQYKQMYDASIHDAEGFWKPIAEQFYFKSKSQGKFLDFNFDVRNGPIYIKWMEGATTNICYNAVDRHVEQGKGDRVAFYW